MRDGAIGSSEAAIATSMHERVRAVIGLLALCGSLSVSLSSTRAFGDGVLAIGDRLEAAESADGAGFVEGAAAADARIVLHDLRFGRHSLATIAGEEVTAMVFLDASCAAVSNAVLALRALDEEFSGGGLKLVGVHANDRESLVEAAAFAEENELRFDIFKDFSQAAKERLGISRTPEAVVFDAERTLRYRGAVLGSLEDGRAEGGGDSSVVAEPLRAAILALLEAQDVPLPEVAASGCLVRQPRPVRGATLTWAAHAAPIFAARCTNCHRDRGVAPFEIASLDDVRTHRDAIADAVAIGRMPPAPRDPRFGAFISHGALSAKERVTLLGWLAEGDIDRAEDGTLPAPKVTSDPELETTDEVKYASTVRSLSPEGNVVRARFEVDWPRGEDRLVEAITLALPRGLRGVVRAELHCFDRSPLFFERPTAFEGTLVAMWGTGDETVRCARAAPFGIPKHRELFLDVSFLAKGSIDAILQELPSADACSVRVGRAPPSQERTIEVELLFSRAAPSESWSLPQDLRLRSILVGGDRSLRAVAIREAPDEAESESKTLVSLPAFDSRWALRHVLADEGLPLRAGARLTASGRFASEGSGRVVLSLVGPRREGAP